MGKVTGKVITPPQKVENLLGRVLNNEAPIPGGTAIKISALIPQSVLLWQNLFGNAEHQGISPKHPLASAEIRRIGRIGRRCVRVPR